jgi:transcriptional regulator with PAS, ATPase and Fis domain
VRELENLLEQAINWSDDPLIDICKIPVRPWESNPRQSLVGLDSPFRNRVEETERELIINALERTNGNKARAARALNMQRSVLYKKLERMKI